MTQHLKVVIVDDDSLQLDYMQSMLKEVSQQLGVTIEVDQYTSAQAFLFELEDHLDWQIAFLDIEMPDLNGMQVAKIIREKELQLALVFATGFAEYAIEGYEVSALAYLLKPIKFEKVYNVIENFLNSQPEEEKSLIIESEGTQVRILLSELIYVEVIQRELAIVTTKGRYSLRQSLSAFQSRLDERFVQTHRAFVVNLAFVSHILKQDVLLVNDEKIPLSRRQVKATQMAFIDYYKEKVFYNE